MALEIGAYKSASLANIVTSYVFEHKEECFRMSKFRGIYHCNGLVILTGQWTKKETQQWFQHYQSIVNELTGGYYLQLTTKLWQPPASDKENSPLRKDKREEGMTVIYDSKFPFLDMEMFWGKNGEMRFQVYQTENQALKYVD
eukprot:12782219-Ditylum_brightwellii.AAC.1